jgi:hypothetical protein
VLHDSTPELRRVADALTAAPVPLMPLQVVFAERAATAGAPTSSAPADLTEAARPVLAAGEELLVAGLEQIQPVPLSGAARAGRAVAVRVSAAVTPVA